ncbi:hypothetical protein DM860_007604 [Cuscuta australis]|uniref:Uncharacterized protein n=1 Tax=Cuscuta australis TaxID=267555 RepID=A0A328E5W6_9ASTE|nr:hypothetical protein DM860_007604 [Cuscuta australis]
MSFVLWLRSRIFLDSLQVLGGMVFTIWAIWKARNQALWEQKVMQQSLTVNLVLKLQGDWEARVAVTELGVTILAISIQTRSRSSLSCMWMPRFSSKRGLLHLDVCFSHHIVGFWR